jgi:hypothetical protein
MSQKKYVLDLLSEMYILGCKPAISSIDVKAKMTDTGEHVDRERY